MHFRELFKGSSIAFAFRIVSALASYVFFYFLARFYGPEGTGVFTTSWTILMISSVVGKMGFDTSIVRFMAESSSTRGYYRMRMIYRISLRIVLVSASIVSVVLILFSQKFTDLFYDSIEERWIVVLVALAVIPYSIMSFNAETLKGLKKILHFSIHQNVTIYFGSLLLMAAFHFFYGSVESAIIALLASMLILMCTSFYTLRSFLRHYPDHDSHYSQDIPKSSKIIGTTLPMMLTNSLFLVMNWTDVMMLAAMTDDAAVGIYNIALKIAALSSIVLIAVNSIAMPKYAELFKVNKVRFKQVVKAVSFLSFTISLPIFIVVILFPDFVIGLFGEGFTKGGHAMVILSASQLFSAFSGSTVVLLNMIGKERTTVYVLGFSVIVNLILNYFLIPLYGLNGAAYATAFSTVLLNGLAVVKIYQYVGFLTFPVFTKGQIKYYVNVFLKKEL